MFINFDRKKQPTESNVDHLLTEASPACNTSERNERLPNGWRIKGFPTLDKRTSSSTDSSTQQIEEEKESVESTHSVKEEAPSEDKVVSQVWNFKKRLLRQVTPPSKEAANKNIYGSKVSTKVQLPQISLNQFLIQK